MTIRDGFPQLNGWRVPIMATDLSSSMLDQCRLGRYSKLEVSRGLSDAMLDKHFDWTGTDWFVKPELRQMVDFKRINLAESWPRMPLFDIVFMRNVLVYFDKIKKQEILTRMARVMRPDGYLFLGGGEILINLDTPFTRHEIDDTICYRPDRGGSTLCRVSP
jgi:chemotaxis protein methyltransferase CheR